MLLCLGAPAEGGQRMAGRNDFRAAGGFQRAALFFRKGIQVEPPGQGTYDDYCSNNNRNGNDGNGCPG